MEKIDIFSDSLYIDYLNDINNDKLIDLYNEYHKKDKGHTKSNIGGWQKDVFRRDHPELENLAYNIERSLHDITWNHFKIDNEIRINLMWMNCNKKYDYNAIHTHPGAFMSGVYYVKTSGSPDQGNIRFHRDTAYQEFVLQSQGIRNGINVPMWRTSYDITPKTGMVIFFPPWYNHEVFSNRTDDERLVIAFNMSSHNNIKEAIHQSYNF